METAIKVLKMEMSPGVDNIPAELVQAGEAIIDILTATCNKIWKTGEWPTTWTQSDFKKASAGYGTKPYGQL